MLLGVREVLKLRNVEFPNLPDKREDAENHIRTYCLRMFSVSRHSDGEPGN